MPGITAVVFDSDGTLIDSADVIFSAYRHLARTFGYAEPSEDTIRAHLQQAHPLPHILQTLFPGESLDALLQENGIYITKNAATAPAFEGIRELLDALQAAGVQMGIVTGGNHMINNLLKQHTFDHYFTSVVHCDRVAFGKPHPEGFLLALEECGADARQAVMVGDSPNDILAGKNGHAAVTVGITHGHASRADLQAADPDYIVDTVAELETLLLKLTKPA